MRDSFFAALAVAVVLATDMAHAQDAQPVVPVIPVVNVVDVGGQPESVLAWDDYIFASNLGAGDGAPGYISRLSLDGHLLERDFLPSAADAAAGLKLTHPMGMIVSSDVLYVADGRRIVAFDLATRSVKFIAGAPAADTDFEYFNDLAVLGNGQLVASATYGKRLYALDLRTLAWSRLTTDTTLGYVNGLAREGDILYVVHNDVQTLAVDNGRVTALEISGHSGRKLWESRFGRFLDGVTIVGANHLLVSDWSDLEAGGALFSVERTGGAVVDSSHWGQRGLADIHYDRGANVLAIPALLEGRIHVAIRPFAVAATVDCEPRSPWPAFAAQQRTVALGLDRFENVATLSVGASSCFTGEMTRDADRIWYEGARLGGPCDLTAEGIFGARVTRYLRNDVFTVDLTRARTPDTQCQNPRFCDVRSEEQVGYRCSR